ncbi:superoxide dismutase family protein [Dactylosporangium sp. NPDC048998]|uniref:superoxide dismutase family protein n=1 Tax=Dactylosporangium sp. NPDC048998 TaxID=3363976 RepID=UPI0037162A21
MTARLVYVPVLVVAPPTPAPAPTDNEGVAMKRGVAATLVLFGPALFAGGCGSDSPSQQRPAASASAPPQPSNTSGTEPAMVTAKGTFQPAATAPPGSTALLYDTSAATSSAAAVLTLHTVGGHTKVALAVTGFNPKRTYGAHLHVNPCGKDPKAAGGHFQHHPEPTASSSPSNDPKYANPQNEVWLDFTTDAEGKAKSNADQPWALTPQHRPYSLVIHEEKTKTGAGEAGTAGGRVACLTITY